MRSSNLHVDLHALELYTVKIQGLDVRLQYYIDINNITNPSIHTLTLGSAQFQDNGEDMQMCPRERERAHTLR